jgi:DNA-binding XRE family transcriptional regulator
MRRWGAEDNELAEEYGLRIIGLGVRRGRLRHGMTQRQLGWRVGLHQSTISRLETGVLRTMRMITLARIIGSVRMADRDLFVDEPGAATRRLPGQRDQPDQSGGMGVTGGTGVTCVTSGTGVTGVTSGTGVTGVTGVTGATRTTSAMGENGTPGVQ